jgi:predicted MFS family arabinose efflux permease
MASTSYLSAVVAFAGFFWHGMQALFIAAVASVMFQRDGLGARMGTCAAVASVPMLVAAPLGGFVVQRGGFEMALLHTGVMYATGALLIGVRRWCRRGDERRRIEGRLAGSVSF